MSPARKRSIYGSLLAAAIALAVAALGAALVAVYAWSTAAVHAETAAAIRTEIAELTLFHRSGGGTAVAVEIRRRLADGSGSGHYYLFAGPLGTECTGNLRDWPGELAESPTAQFDLPLEQGGETVLRTIRAESTTLVDGGRLLVGRDVTEHRAFRRRLGFTLAGLGLLVVLLAVASGLAVGARLLRRVNLMNRTILGILGGGAGHRVPEGAAGDEFDRLAKSFNELLDRNDRLITRVREVSNSIAHDLRTPLTRLRAHVESALRAPRDATRDAGALEKTLSETDAVLGTFAALLKIAQVEDGTLQDQMGEVDLQAVVADTADLYEPVAEAAGLRLVTETRAGLIVRGDRHLIAQALANLIDNAIKYGAPADAVAVTASREDGRVVMAVADHGPGVPEADRARVVERFVRLETSRGKPGAGLGLSLVQAVCELHGALLTLEDNRPGLRVRISFPAAPSAGGSAAGETA